MTSIRRSAMAAYLKNGGLLMLNHITIMGRLVRDPELRPSLRLIGRGMLPG